MNGECLQGMPAIFVMKVSDYLRITFGTTESRTATNRVDGPTAYNQCGAPLSHRTYRSRILQFVKYKCNRCRTSCTWVV
jgi:hypothetical protein